MLLPARESTAVLVAAWPVASAPFCLPSPPPLAIHSTWSQPLLQVLLPVYCAARAATVTLALAQVAATKAKLGLGELLRGERLPLAAVGVPRPEVRGAPHLLRCAPQLPPAQQQPGMRAQRAGECRHHFTHAFLGGHRTFVPRTPDCACSPTSCC